MPQMKRAPKVTTTKIVPPSQIQSSVRLRRKGARTTCSLSRRKRYLDCKVSLERMGWKGFLQAHLCGAVENYTNLLNVSVDKNYFKKQN